MSQDISTRWFKNGAHFADGLSAHASKCALYPAEYIAEFEACFASMYDNGILLEPVTYHWDQTDFILTTRKIATSREAYQAAVTFDGAISSQLSADAGWTLLDVASS
jgi:hypothetical protein